MLLIRARVELTDPVTDVAMAMLRARHSVSKKSRSVVVPGCPSLSCRIIVWGGPGFIRPPAYAELDAAPVKAVRAAGGRVGRGNSQACLASEEVL